MKQSRLMRGIIYFGAAVIAIYSLFPIYWITISPLRGYSGFFADSTKLWPTGFKLDYFNNIWNSTSFPTYYLNSFIVGGIVTAITIVLSTLMAYVLTRFKFIGSSLLLNSMLIGYMLPPMLLAIPLLGMFINMGIDDTIIALTISHIALTLPFGVWMLVSFFKTIPFDLEESSWIDGANRLKSIIHVIFPLMIPGIISVGVFTFIISFTDYVFGLMIVSSETNKTIAVGMAFIKDSTALQRGDLLAGAALIAIPMLFLFSFVTRYFIKGLTAGAVKG